MCETNRSKNKNCDQKHIIKGGLCFVSFMLFQLSITPIITYCIDKQSGRIIIPVFLASASLVIWVLAARYVFHLMCSIIHSEVISCIKSKHQHTQSTQTSPQKLSAENLIIHDINNGTDGIHWNSKVAVMIPSTTKETNIDSDIMSDPGTSGIYSHATKETNIDGDVMSDQSYPGTSGFRTTRGKDTQKASKDIIADVIVHHYAANLKID